MEKSGIICKESESSLDQEENDEFASITDGDNDEDYIKMLLDRERPSVGIQRQESWGDWISGARLDAIQYILKKRGVLGFRFQTAYLSVTYLDRFLSRISISAEKSWAMRLLAVGCLSLAAKMEEPRVPGLSEFCFEYLDFDQRARERMELLILSTLDWKMGSVTPFAFVHFFVKKLFENSPRKAVRRIVEVILFAVRDANMMVHKPSVIAASATLVALDSKLTRHALVLRIDALTSSGFLEIEDFVACYNQLQELDFGDLRLNKEIKSPDVSPTCVQRLEASAGAKRKSLEFDQSNGIDDPPNKKQDQL